MATIQIREIPESVYEVIRRRARADGQSIQAYMRDRLVEMAGRPTKADAVQALEAALDEGPVDAASIVADVRADRR